MPLTSLIASRKFGRNKSTLFTNHIKLIVALLDFVLRMDITHLFASALLVLAGIHFALGEDCGAESFCNYGCCDGFCCQDTQPNFPDNAYPDKPFQDDLLPEHHVPDNSFTDYSLPDSSLLHSSLPVGVIVAIAIAGVVGVALKVCCWIAIFRYYRRRTTVVVVRTAATGSTRSTNPYHAGYNQQLQKV